MLEFITSRTPGRITCVGSTLYNSKDRVTVYIPTFVSVMYSLSNFKALTWVIIC